jgi:CBS domain containing-hemolysin-like protein
VTPTLVTCIVALLALNAYLAALETVLTRLNLVRALRLEDEDRPGSEALLWLTEHRVGAMSVVLLLQVVARTGIVVSAVLLGLRVTTHPAAVAGIVAGVALAVLVVGEIVPRTATLRHLVATGLALAGSARGVVRATDPLARAAVALGRALVPQRGGVSGPYASDDDLRGAELENGDDEDTIEPEERAMIRSIFELADTRVREIMTPRPDMVMVGEDATLAEVVEVVSEHGLSRLPVHEPGDPDRIVGIVYAKDILTRVATGERHGRWGDLVRTPTYVPETKRGDELLRDLQAAAVHLAIVVDEYGGIVGLVTIEDILEEIVGEIVDEHDNEEPLVEVLGDGALRIDARLGVDDLNELLSAALPEEGWDTVGGLVFGTLGRVPVEGEVVELDGFRMTVESVQGRRVGKVLVEPLGRDEDDDEDDGGGDVPVGGTQPGTARDGGQSLGSDATRAEDQG